MSWARGASKRRAIPSIGSREITLGLDDYSKGFNTFTSNDKMPVKDGGVNLWRLAQDARIITLGEYESRKGTDFHSDAAGETQDQTQTSTTGAANQSFSETSWLAQKFVAGATARLSKVSINIKNAASATGTVIVEVWSDNSGSPNVKLARSSISAADVTSSYQYLTARFISAPAITSGSTYWIVVRIQSTGTNSYSWSSTTTATTALTSTDSGTSWSSTSFALNFKQYYATDGGTKGLWRAYKSDGTKVTLQVQGTTLYKVDNTTGALTSIKTGLTSTATDYRFVLVNDIVYYVNGYDGLRKWDFTTESQVRAGNYSHICIHKGLLMLVSRDDPNKIEYSNFADYETFTSTDFIYVDSPKTGDPITALMPLNGSLQIKTKDNGFILSGSDNATFTLDEAPDQKGTFRQESMTADKNFMYFLSSDGVYRSNGSEPQLLTADIYDDIKTMQNKDNCVLMVSRGRLYLWFTDAGSAVNNKCYVISLNFGDDGGTIESLDTGAYVSRAFSAFRDDDELLVASSLIGQVYWQEQDTNDNTNLGDDINFILQTHYITGPSSAILKQVRFWEPRFGTQSGNYTITAEYAYDLRNNWQTVDAPNIQGAGATYGSGIEYADGTVYGSSAETQPSLNIPGEYRRIAVRYKHFATRQPNKFLGHTFVMQIRRMR